MSKQETKSVLSTTDLPPYASPDPRSQKMEEQLKTSDSQSTLTSEKVKGTTHLARECHVHGPSKTPLIEAHLRQPGTKASVQALINSLSNAIEEEKCLKCAMQDAARTLTSCARDYRTAKKNGQWSREEKKALKAEAKGLANDLKGIVKATWKASRA